MAPKKLKRQESKRKPLSPELAKLQEFFDLMARNGIAELEWESKGNRFKARTHAGSAASAAYSAPAPAAPQPTTIAASQTPAPAAPSAPAALPANRKQVSSPFVGTFYRAPSPTADMYVKEGQIVKKGDPLCIIEAMKLMNAIESEFAGKIVAILVQNGQPVEFGEPLFLIETS